MTITFCSCQKYCLASSCLLCLAGYGSEHLCDLLRQKSLWVPENNVYLTLQFKELKDSVTEIKYDMNSETYLQRITMHLLWAWFYSVRCLFKFLHCLAFLNFIVFHQVYSPPHSYFLHFTRLNCFLILLQHCNTRTIHTSTVLFYDKSLLSATLCPHSITQVFHHPSHTVHYWVLALAQHLIDISPFLEPSVSVWFISRTLWKNPSLSLPIL
jgi:hypothetical protein